MSAWYSLSISHFNPDYKTSYAIKPKQASYFSKFASKLYIKVFGDNVNNFYKYFPDSISPYLLSRIEYFIDSSDVTIAPVFAKYPFYCIDPSDY